MAGTRKGAFLQNLKRKKNQKSVNIHEYAYISAFESGCGKKAFINGWDRNGKPACKACGLYHDGE